MYEVYVCDLYDVYIHNLYTKILIISCIYVGAIDVHMYTYVYVYIYMYMCVYQCIQFIARYIDL